MSDEPEPDEFEVTPEYIEQLKTREARFAILAYAIEVEADLRDNPTIKALMAAAKRCYDEAVAEIIEISPLNHVEIGRCLVNMKTFIYMKRALEEVLTRGKQAEDRIRAEDQ